MMDWLGADFQEQVSQLGTIMLAALFGAAVGFERELADKPAGLRTHMFVCAAAAMLMLVGKIVIRNFQGIEGASDLTADPIRVIQAIVIGISFLGAGTIIHSTEHGVEGLTTASSILLTSGIGIATAVKQFWLAAGVSLFAFVVLFAVGRVEKKVQRWNRRRTIRQRQQEI